MPDQILRSLPCKFKFDGKTLTNAEPMRFEVVEEPKTIKCCRPAQNNINRRGDGWGMDTNIGAWYSGLEFCPWCGALQRNPDFTRECVAREPNALQSTLRADFR